MSIQDIIKAATPGPWWTAGGVVSPKMDFITSCDPYVFQVPFDPTWDNATFAASFDPEHVALMEAVIRAADEMNRESATFPSLPKGISLGVVDEDAVCDYYADVLVWLAPLLGAVRGTTSALAAYRNERGLS